MQTITMLAAVLAIIAIFLLLSFLISHIEGLAFLAPRSSKHVVSSAGTFCVEKCQDSSGRCPLTELGRGREACPLWQFVEADLPTVIYGSPFAYLHSKAHVRA